ncbi:hypothetical protein ['Camptotheca acuminata' phytoplasma]|uniref:hypothetical protein n=1 Tax='Camptotheca acuminata' phytoplasma TaxID=3239192 RepID=UPI003519E202
MKKYNSDDLYISSFYKESLIRNFYNFSELYKKNNLFFNEELNIKSLQLAALIIKLDENYYLSKEEYNFIFGLFLICWMVV